MKCRATFLSGAFAAVTLIAGSASAGGETCWSDDFDSYAAGTSLHDVGGWRGWAGSAGGTAFVTDDLASSAPNSVEITAPADLVQELDVDPTGVYTLTAKQWVPSTQVGDNYFILLNTYSEAGTKNWSMQVRFNAAAGTLTSDFDGAVLPIIMDAWVDIEVTIDLDANSQTFLYDGEVLYTKSWTEGVSGGGTLDIQALNLFDAGSSGSVFYDDIALTGCPLAGIPGDTCDDALPIACGEAVEGSTVGATPETLGFCGTTDGTGGAIWYVTTGTGGDMTISTCDTADFDTKLRVWEGSCDALECVGGNDDGTDCTGFTSEFTWSSVKGATYYILVHGFLGAEGSYEMALSCEDVGDCPESTMTVSILLDDFPGETTWEIVDNISGDTVATGGPYDTPGALVMEDVCVATGGCYDFTIFDAFGDGICCGFGDGAYEVFFDGEVVASGSEFGDSETTSNIGGGCPCEGDEITVSILFDDFPGETSFEITDASSGKVVASGDGFSGAGSTFEESYCLPEGCYVFTIFDAFGDGICCGFGDGAYSVALNGEVVVTGGEFGDSEATELGSTCVCEGDIARIEILTDNFGEETTYELVDNDSGDVIASGGPYESNTLIIDEVCVASDGCYTFTIFDAFGDGICCGFGEGSYRVLLNGVIQGSGGEFADSESTELGGGCPAGDPTLALTLDSECVAPGAEIQVELSMLDLGGLPIAGYQAFLAYDPSEVSFNGATYTDDPFGEHIIMGDDINPEPGLILLAAGVDLLGGQPDSAADSLLATLSFTVVEGAGCTTSGPPVVFSDSFPHPSRLTDRAGTDIMPNLIDAPSLADTTAPDVSDCPGDVATIADAGGCDAFVEWAPPTVSDNCDEAPSLVYCIDLDDNGSIDVADIIDPGAVFPAGTHRVIAKATDACDNVNDDCSFLVSVDAVNELLVSVELSPTVDSPLDRCITIALHTCSGDVIESRHQLSFTGGVAAELSLLVPCGDYQCVTARDELHTLAATDEDDFGIDGLSYVADFTNSGGDNDWLVGGDLNDDGVIEILDFGIFIDKLSQFLDPSDCDTTGPHADISGNGLVFTEDFSFIQINFLQMDDEACCAPAGLAGPIDQGPRTRISVEELYARGLGHLAVADLNHDGWVDTDDMSAFGAGVRPSKRFLAPSRGSLSK